MLRIQLERQSRKVFPSVKEYFEFFALTRERLAKAKDDVIILHPGPMNRGVEIARDVADGPYSVILDQVANGVAVRMAVLYLLDGARGSGGAACYEAPGASSRGARARCPRRPPGSSCVARAPRLGRRLAAGALLLLRGDGGRSEPGARWGARRPLGDGRSLKSRRTSRSAATSRSSTRRQGRRSGVHRHPCPPARAGTGTQGDGRDRDSRGRGGRVHRGRLHGEHASGQRHRRGDRAHPVAGTAVRVRARLSGGARCRRGSKARSWPRSGSSATPGASRSRTTAGRSGAPS